MSPEQTALREEIDRAVRARVERENEHLRLCSGCAMPMSDWTPGCGQCWDRHRSWRRNDRYPYPFDPVLELHVRGFGLAGFRTSGSRWAA